MGEIRLGGGERRTLEVRVDGRRKAYHVPLMGSLSVGEALAFRKAEAAPEDEREDAYFMAFYELLCRHVDRDVVDELSMDDFNALAEAWGGASEEGDATLGE